MPRTPNREHGELIVDSIVFKEPTPETPPPSPGALRFEGGKFSFQDTTGSYDPRFSPVDEEGHATLATLTHALAQNAYTEVTRVQGFLQSIVVWESAARLRKIRETIVTRASNKVTQVVTTQYNAAGAVRETLTCAVTRGVSARISTVTSTHTRTD
jgi:hypothetical protein